MKKRHCHLTFYPEIYAAFKLLCDASGYRKLNEVLEPLMLKCIEENSLGLPPRGDSITQLMWKVELLDKRQKLAEKLGWHKKKKRSDYTSSLYDHSA